MPTLIIKECLYTQLMAETDAVSQHLLSLCNVSGGV